MKTPRLTPLLNLLRRHNKPVDADEGPSALIDIHFAHYRSGKYKGPTLKQALRDTGSIRRQNRRLRKFNKLSRMDAETYNMFLNCWTPHIPDGNDDVEEVEVSSAHDMFRERLGEEWELDGLRRREPGQS